MQSQSTAPAFSLATLRDALAEMQAEHLDREWRLIKAANIVAVRSVERYPHGGIWFVESECEAGKVYTLVPTPNGDTCDCMDYRQRGGPCKHALAVELYQRCERRDAEQADPTPADNVTPFPTPAFDPDRDRFVLTAKGHAALASPEHTPA